MINCQSRTLWQDHRVWKSIKALTASLTAHLSVPLCYASKALLFLNFSLSRRDRLPLSWPCSKTTGKHRIVAGFTPHKDQVHTLIYDNGKELTEHEQIAEELEVEIYFAHPYSSWERGLNENTNGLIRQYFPKGRELTAVAREEIEHAAD